MDTRWLEKQEAEPTSVLKCKYCGVEFHNESELFGHEQSCREALSITDLSLEEWQNGLQEAREDFKESVQTNFPNKWFVTEVCAAVYSQLFIKDITQPFALFLIGSPSSKKTTILGFYDKLVYSYPSDKFTPKSFVSHSATVKREELSSIDLLPRIKNKCFITPELAPVFGAGDDELLDNISIMTRVLDGQGFTSDSGVHGQRGYREPIMFTWLGAIVDIPYRVWKVLGNLGSRLYFLRLESENTDEDQDMNNLLGRSYMVKLEECRQYARRYVDYIANYKIDSWDKSKDDKHTLRVIIRVARLLAHLRAVVPVWSTEGTSGMEYAFGSPTIENPDRAESALYNLARGHALSCGRLQINNEDLTPVIAVAFASASKERYTLLEILLSSKGECKTRDLMEKLGCSRSTALKTMKELSIIGLGIIDEAEDSKTKPETIIRLKPEFNWFLDQEFDDIRKGVVRIDNLAKGGVCALEAEGKEEEDKHVLKG